MCMASILQLETPFLASFSVLLIMTGMSLVLSLSFYLKSRSTRKLAKDLTVGIFDRTFNVFDPFSHPRRTFHSYLFFIIFSPLVAFSWTFILVFVVFLRIFQAGLLLAPIALIMSLGLMMLDEAHEIYQNASILENAVKKGTSLGNGDIAVLSFAKITLRRLSAYYLVLAVCFTACFLVIPHVFPAMLWMFAYAVGNLASITTINGSFDVLAPFVASFFFAISTLAVFVIARKIKARILDSSPPGSLTSATSAEIRRKITYERQDQILDSDPEEMTW